MTHSNQRREILDFYKWGAAVKDIAAIYGVTPAHIKYCVRVSNIP